MPDVVAGLFTIERNVDDLLLTSKLGAISGRAGGVFVAHGSLELCGCASVEVLDSPNDWALPDDDTAAFWQELQTHPVFQKIRLVAPRFVLRQPYGKKSDPIDSFDFDELGPAPPRSGFLWGNPAVLSAYAQVTGNSLVDDLPMPIYANGSGQAQQPAIEAYVSDRAASAAADVGIHLLRANRTTGEVAIV